MNTTITIERQLGCGGSYVGQRLAAELGLRFVDREVLRLTAEAFRVEEAQLARREERVEGLWKRLCSGVSVGVFEMPYIPPPLLDMTDQEIFAQETDVMMKLAAKYDCVIVGRAAAHVLPHNEGLVTVLLHAPLEFRIARVIELYGAPSRDAALATIEESDAMRKNYSAKMCGCNWTCATRYDLALDASALPLDDIADVTLGFVKAVYAARGHELALAAASVPAAG